ncbi:MAG: hypothetical protein K0Q55_1001 [Verrucomicrobia bacterium]|nr:hypothetical protein [Verrucomicrobiota bacterium]
MGRLPNVEGTGISWGGVAVHLLLAAAYSFIVIPVARLWRVWRGIMVGCLMGLVCYGLNWTLAHFLVPSYEGQEGRVLLTHLLFGLFVTAIYKGLTIERVRGIQQTP